jgi:hypothetical protein
MEKRSYCDCQKMPEDVRAAFFLATSYMGLPNDSVAKWGVGDLRRDAEEFPDQYDDVASACLVDEWLIAEGAVDGESVLIARWW